MIKVLRTDSVEFKETRRYAVSINADDMSNVTRRVVMVSISIDKPSNEKAFNVAKIEGTLNEQERTEIRCWAERMCRGPVKLTMSVTKS